MTSQENPAPRPLARAREQGYIFDVDELPGEAGDVYRGRTEAVRRTAREGENVGRGAGRTENPSLAARGFFHGSRDDIDRFHTEHPNRKDHGWLGRGVCAASAPAWPSGADRTKKRAPLSANGLGCDCPGMCADCGAAIKCNDAFVSGQCTIAAATSRRDQMPISSITVRTASF